jgi:hypothetical protein
MKLILQIGIFLATMLSSLLGLAESKSDKIYDLFSGKEGVTTMSFSKSAVKPFEIFMDEKSKEVIYKMEKVRFMAYDENKGSLSSANAYDRILKGLESNEYFFVDPNEFNSKDGNIKIEAEKVKMIGRGNKQKMDEFHVVILDKSSSILFSFYGDITIKDVTELAKFSKSSKNSCGSSININIEDD